MFGVLGIFADDRELGLLILFSDLPFLTSFKLCEIITKIRLRNVVHLNPKGRRWYDVGKDQPKMNLMCTYNIKLFYQHRCRTVRLELESLLSFGMLFLVRRFFSPLGGFLHNDPVLHFTIVAVAPAGNICSKSCVVNPCETKTIVFNSTYTQTLFEKPSKFEQASGSG